MGTATVSRRARAGSLAALTLAAIASGCGGTTSSPSAEPPAPTTTAPPTPAPAVVARVPIAEATRFALLRTRPEGLPATVRATLRAPIAGMNYALAQRIPAHAPGRYWLVPGRGYLCVVSEMPGTPGVGTVCSTTAQARTDGVATTSIPRAGQNAPVTGPRLIVGVAPDGAKAVIVHTGDRTATAHVTSGLFVHRDHAHDPPDRIAVRR
jgi:hypothetical protein